MPEPCNPGYCVCCGCTNNLDCVTDWRYDCNGIKGPFRTGCECEEAMLADVCGPPYPECFASALEFECCPDATCKPEGDCPP